MNYLGHKGVATATLPLILFPKEVLSLFNIQGYNNSIFNISSYLIDFSNNFISIINQHPFVFIFSIMSYWIGSTFIDFIDFKIIKKLMSKEKQKSQFYYHRQWTHALIDNILYFYLSIYFLYHTENIYFYIIVFYFLGVFTHLLADMITGSIPIFFYGHYAKKMSRIGIDRFIPTSKTTFFTKTLPKYFDRLSFLFFIFGVVLFFYFGGNDMILQPLLSSIF